MNTIRSLRLLIAITIATLFGIATVPAQPSGQWDFNSGNLNATVGSALQYADGPGGPTELGTAFNSTTTFGIPNINGTAASVMRFPAATNTMGYFMPAPLAGNGGGGLVNDYTIIFDLLYPTAGTVRPLLDTDGGVFVQGAELIANTGNGIGVTPNGPFDGTIAANTWYRVGFSVRAISSTETEIHKFVNGLEVGSQVNNGSAQGWGTDGRLAMTPAGVALILANTVGTATLGYVNSIQLRDVALNAGQMEALGGPSAAGIPQVIPPVPSFVQSRSPALNATGVNPQPAISVVLHQGDTTINSGSIQLSL